MMRVMFALCLVLLTAFPVHADMLSRDVEAGYSSGRGYAASGKGVEAATRDVQIIGKRQAPGQNVFPLFQSHDRPRQEDLYVFYSRPLKNRENRFALFRSGAGDDSRFE
jgi:hypothetical protein